MDPQENEKKQLEKLKFLKGCIFFFRADGRRVCREKSEPKRKGGKGKKRSENNGRTGQTLLSTAPASWSSNPIPGENERACRKHAYLIFKSKKQQFDAIFSEFAMFETIFFFP